ncbi:MAG: hypothetical protein HY860_03840 [Chlamydiales bacterium]|nr:hypothetical protein [Chlamydiales bacterium]
MASIYKRKLKEGKGYSWRATVRFEGHPSVSKSFDRKQEAEDWAQNVKRCIKTNQFSFNQHKYRHAFSDLIDRYINDGIARQQWLGKELPI